MSSFYYCTALHDNQIAWLSGPYATHQHALDDVERVKRLATASGDPKADFAGYGTTSKETCQATYFPALHALTGKRDEVTGEWITRCSLKAHRDPRALPKGLLVGEVYGTFKTALHERDVDCPGCRIQVSAVGAWALGVMAERGGVLREDTRYSVNAELKQPIIYMPKEQINRLSTSKLVRDGKLTSIAKSLIRRTT